jgi:hypothetical protein
MSTGIINNTIAGMKPKKGIESSTSLGSTQTVTASSCSDTSETKQRPLGGSNNNNNNDDESITESPRRKKIKPMTDEFNDDEASVEDDENENDDANNDDSTGDPEDNENNSGSDDNEHEDDDNESENPDDDNNESDGNEEDDEFHADERNNDSDREDDEDDDDNLLELLRRAAEAQGIPFELLVRQAIETHGGDDDEDEPREYPFGTKLPTSLDEIANFILSDKCRNILVLAGAGMSVSAGTYTIFKSKRE